MTIVTEVGVRKRARNQVASPSGVKSGGRKSTKGLTDNVVTLGGNGQVASADVVVPIADIAGWVVDARRLAGVRVVYPVLVDIARDLSYRMRTRHGGLGAAGEIRWVTTEELLGLLKPTELKESTRSLWTRVLAPLQTLCLQHSLPDLSAIIIMKTRAKVDTGDLLRPGDSWWDVYIRAGLCQKIDIPFWFNKFRLARDYAWPAELPF